MNTLIFFFFHINCENNLENLEGSVEGECHRTLKVKKFNSNNLEERQTAEKYCTCYNISRLKKIQEGNRTKYHC